MSGRTYSRALKLGAVALARLANPSAAIEAFGVNERQLRRWVADEPELTDWGAIEQILLARGARMSAEGQTKGLVQTLTGAGIAARNRRYAELIRRREQRRAEEVQAAVPAEPTPLELAMRSLSWDQRRLACDLLDAELEGRTDGPVEADPAVDEEAVLLAWLEGIAALSPDDVAARLAELQPPPLPEPRPLDGQVLDPWEPGLTPAGRWMENVTPEPPSAHWEDWQAIEAAQEAHHHD